MQDLVGRPRRTLGDPKKIINVDLAQGLNTSWDRILKECANMKLKEARIRNPNILRDFARASKSK